MTLFWIMSYEICVYFIFVPLALWPVVTLLLFLVSCKAMLAFFRPYRLFSFRLFSLLILPPK